MSFNTAENRNIAVAPELLVIEGKKRTEETTFTLPRKEILALTIILVALQIADGLLTGVGVYHMGVEMEANPLLRTLMDIFGATTALVAVKSFAIGIIGILSTLAATVPWLGLAMRGMIVLYSLVAILPWSAILYGYFS